MRRTIIFALILCTLLMALLCGCSGKAPADTTSGASTSNDYIRVNGKSHTSMDDPYILTLISGKSLTLSLSASVGNIRAELDSDNVSVTFENDFVNGDSIIFSASTAGETKIKLYSPNTEAVFYALVKVSEPYITFDDGIFTEGDGSESSPYVVHVRLGKDLTLPFTSKDETDISTCITTSDDYASFSIEGSVLKIHGNKLGHITNYIHASPDTYIYIKAIVIEDTYAISGRVINKSDPEKVYSDVTVRLSASSSIKLYSKTDENGVFWFTDIDAGRYSLTLGDDSELILSEEVTISSVSFTNAKEKLVIADLQVTEKPNGGTEQ